MDNKKRQFGPFEKFFSSRYFRHGSNTFVLSVAFIGIIVLINYLAYQNTFRRDITENQNFTLAPETLDTLRGFDNIVQASAFYTIRTSPERAKGLLEEYRFQSNGNFVYEIIDPEADPGAASRADVTRDGTIVLEMGDHRELITTVTEQELTGALVRLLNPESKKVNFLTGHGEKSPDDFGDQSYSQIKRTLESKNYSVSTINLLASNQMPEDTNVLVIAGPLKPVSSSEIELIDVYLNNGGSLIVMQEPNPTTEFEDLPDPMAEYLLDRWGISFVDDIVVDTTSSQPFTPFAGEYGSHPITEKLQQVTTLFPTARTAKAATQKEGVSQVEIVKSSPQAWGLNNFDTNEDDSGITIDENRDSPGPMSLAVAAEHFQNGSRLVVFGDSDFASDANFIVYANEDLFINSVDWAVGQDDLISLTPKSYTQRIMLPPQQYAMNLILLFLVIIIPGILLAAGIIVWIRRNRRG